MHTLLKCHQTVDHAGQRQSTSCTVRKKCSQNCLTTLEQLSATYLRTQDTSIGSLPGTSAFLVISAVFLVFDVRRFENCIGNVSTNMAEEMSWQVTYLQNKALADATGSPGDSWLIGPWSSYLPGAMTKHGYLDAMQPVVIFAKVMKVPTKRTVRSTHMMGWQYSLKQKPTYILRLQSTAKNYGQPNIEGCYLHTT